MITTKQKTGPDKCKEQETKADNRHDSGPATLPSHDKSFVQKGCVKEPGDKRPHLFGVPLPVGTKGILRVYGSGDHPDSQKREAVNQGIMVDGVKSGEGGQPVVNRAKPFAFDLVFLNKIHNSG